MSEKLILGGYRGLPIKQEQQKSQPGFLLFRAIGVEPVALLARIVWIVPS
ncbi:MAG: hypothetical protein FWC20_09545 [Oscillospiraceae bacterium]|nr:hypothetical protein [Oscillospiraceae bacterium]MCL2279633.1 hypothetical protein [Oscillospiraceae bacterium]